MHDLRIADVVADSALCSASKGEITPVDKWQIGRILDKGNFVNSKPCNFRNLSPVFFGSARTLIW